MTEKIKIEDIIRLFFILTINLEKIADRLLREKLKLSQTQFRTLMAIKFNPGASQKFIADFWGVEEASASRQIEFLAKKKLISKKTSKVSRREHILVLTPLGLRLIDKALPLVHQHTEDIFKTLKQEEREKLSRSLEKMAQLVKCEKQDLKSSHIIK